MSSEQIGLPVLTYSTGGGWYSCGTAKSLAAARRIVMANLPSSAKGLLTYGFKVSVGRRTPLQRELNGGPDGYIWDISFSVPSSASHSYR